MGSFLNHGLHGWHGWSSPAGSGKSILDSNLAQIRDYPCHPCNPWLNSPLAHGFARAPHPTLTDHPWSETIPTSMSKLTTSTRIFRSVLQLGVVVLLVLAAKDAAYRQNALRDSRQLRDAFAPEVPLYERTLAAHPGLDRTLNRLRGNLWVFDAGGIALADSLAVVENLVVSRRWVGPFLVAGSWLLLLTLGCGRVFCAYLCPAALLFEGGRLLRRGLLRLGFPLPNVAVPRFTKYLVLALGLLLAALTGRYILAWVYPPRLIGLEIGHVILEGSLRAGVILVLGILLVEILAMPRVWCTHLCPGGALYSLIGAGRLLRIKRLADRCTRCGACRPVCPYDLRPDQASPGMECDNCTRCIAACPEAALTYRRAKPLPEETPS